MDIAALSTYMSQSSLSTKVDVALCKTILDTAKENSANLIKDMELSVNPNLGSNLDVRV